MTCDRCGTDVEEKRIYKGKAWAEFMRDGEKRICTACMWTTPGYVERYGEWVRLEEQP